MLFERQKHLLALVEALGGEIGNRDFQKLLFLYCCEIQPKPSYEFVPYRFGGFSKGVLSKACENVGICYEHRPKLGILSADRQKLETQADYDALFAVYKRDCLPKQTDVLREIGIWVEAGQRVALTCYERLSQQCHWRCVAEALERMFGAGCAPRHL